MMLWAAGQAVLHGYQNAVPRLRRENGVRDAAPTGISAAFNRTRCGILVLHFSNVARRIRQPANCYCHATSPNPKLMTFKPFVLAHALHRTGPNSTDRPRRSWVIQFCRADTRMRETARVCDDRLLVARGGHLLAEPVRERPIDLIGLMRGALCQRLGRVARLS